MTAFRSYRIPAILGALLAAAAALPAAAAPIAPTSYAMPNGDGKSTGGTYNYWDGIYAGSGSTTTDGAALSGGLGKLTDGVVSTQPWYLVSNVAGTGEYVGWYTTRTLDPVVTFNFAGGKVINGVTIQMDNTGVGGVFAPQAIKIDGITESFTAPAAGTVGSVSFTGLSLLGASHTIEFDQQPATWTFVSEISFDGTASAIPEPVSAVLLGVGLLGLGFARRRKA